MESYDRYFGALNTLVNSTMHNERQFVQATGFNAVFYSVPPKIMAFYNAYIYLIKQILLDEPEPNERQKEYTFLIYPSFSSLISLDRLSLNEEPPCDDRLLSVCVSEKNLYDIRAFLYQMVHELGHYVGDKLRGRSDIRKECIRRTLLCCAMSMCGVEEWDYPLLQEFSRKKEKKQFDYLENIGEQSRYNIRSLEDSQTFLELAEAYCQKLEPGKDFRDAMLDEMGIQEADQKAYVKHYTRQYAHSKYADIRSKWNAMGGEEQKKHFGDIVNLVRSVYRECYADLQMVLVLGMRGEDYLKTFFNHHEVSVGQVLEQDEDITRICAIFRLMTACGLWEAPGTQTASKSESADERRYRTIHQKIRKYNEDVIRYENRKKGTVIQDERNTAVRQEKVVGIVHTLKDSLDFQSGIRLDESLPEDLDNESSVQIPPPLYIVAADLYCYLLEAMEKSLKAYFEPAAGGSQKNSKQEQIRHLREVVREVLAFEDAAKVFTRMEETVRGYMEDLGIADKNQSSG